MFHCVFCHLIVDCCIRFRHFNKYIGIDSPNITCNIGIEHIFVTDPGDLKRYVY